MAHGLKLLRGMWDLPGTGNKPMSPALAGRFLTIAPPGKSERGCFFCVEFEFGKFFGRSTIF